MNDERIQAVFEKYGQFVTGKDCALIQAIAEAVAPQRTWVDLTDREMMDAIDIDDSPMEMGRKIEQALKEKNT